MTKPITLNIQRTIAEWAAKYCPRLKPDDAILALVRMNVRELDSALDASYARVVGELALYRALARSLPNGGGEDVDEALRAANETCNKIRRDVNTTHLLAAEAIREADAAYHQSIAIRYFVLGMFASLVPLLCGVGLAAAHATWWRL
jgi:hypothetical protein